MCVYVYVPRVCHVCWYPQKPEEGIRPSGAVVKMAVTHPAEVLRTRLSPLKGGKHPSH